MNDPSAVAMLSPPSPADTQPVSESLTPKKAAASPGAVLRSAKILADHLERLAIVYIRQSSPHQVLHHRESRARQYALVDHAVALGWLMERVLVIDDDQGQSGKSAAQRGGFHRLLAEVTMEHVGLVLGLEMSRLARSSRDWHHLLELCAVCGTILADEDGVYNPNDSNDRLLLGLKGTISEFELVTMRNRLERGRLHKAERGELFQNVPTGYVKLSAERIALDPHEEVRAVVRLIFDKYEELGSEWAVFRYLLRNKIHIGIRPFHGPERGQLVWRRPTRSLIQCTLCHPIYAGVYTYGRRPRQRLRSAAGDGSQAGQRAPQEEWKVFKRDSVPAYITWEQYLANQERIRQHRCRAGLPGVPRSGEALLGGLLVCGSCGYCLRPRYAGASRPYYHCQHHLYEGTERTCTGLCAGAVDDVVAQQVLRALQPAALELSVHALEAIEGERARLDRHWQQRRERARHETRTAERCYRVVDPEHRLVARTLEQRWEEALRQEQVLADEYDRFLQEKPLRLSAVDKASLKQLAADLPALWQAAGTTATERKEIIRHLVDKVVVHATRNSEYVDVTIHWQGGFTSQHEVVRPVNRYQQLRDYQSLRERLTHWRRRGCTAAQIAAKLNAEGFHPPQRRGVYYVALVRQLLCRFGLSKHKAIPEQLAADEWWLADLARELDIPRCKLRDWLLQGWLHGRQTQPDKFWIVWADQDEVRRLRNLKKHSKRGVTHYPKPLTTPKERPIMQKGERS
jgi:DNA invertase Pin-like site-specific DNA recombinase